MSIDLRSVFFALALSLLAVAVGTLVASRSHPFYLKRAARFWVAACALQTLAWSALALRGLIPDAVTVLGGNLMLAASFSAYYLGVCAIDRSRAHPALAYWPVPVTAVALVAFYFVHSDFRARAIVISAVGLVQMALCAAHLLRSRPGRPTTTFRMTGAGFAVIALVLVVRLISSFYLPADVPPEALLAVVRPVDQLVFLSIFLVVYLVSAGFVLMCNESLSAELSTLAMTDPLTGRYNRRTIEQLGCAEEARAHRSGHAVSLVLLDIDKFKSINDTFGHPVGDAAIRHVGDVVASIVRAGDTVARVGGEEFLVLMPETDETEALAVAERIRAAIEGSGLAEPLEAVRMTVSVGVAGAVGDDVAFEPLLSAADAALYSAKRAGRNRVVAAGAATLA